MNKTEIRLLLKEIIEIIEDTPVLDDVINTPTAYAQDEALEKISALCKQALKDILFQIRRR